MADGSHARRSSIDVFIRVRPMRMELHEVRHAWDLSGTTLREKSNVDSLFTFDHVYGPDATTLELYEACVRDRIISNVAKGYNGTVFAYGQTGSGKSFTMLGAGGGQGGSNPDGLVSLSVRGLFAEIEREQQRSPATLVEVFVTMIELYNEQLRDLLLTPGSAAAPLSIRENEHGVYVHNAIKRRVQSARECAQVIHAHAQGRVSAATAMNEQSSRSHCVVRILVEKTIYIDGGSSGGSSGDDDEEEDDTATGGAEDAAMQKKIVATLNLVDLAGSERVAKTGSTGARMVEGGHINKSLTILTTVINRLTESGPGSFVPYRDSRLTHLLKTAIGGNSFTAIFCCVTPAIQHADETRSTLLFAARAKTVKNRIVLNEVANPKTKLRELEVQLRRYRRMVVFMTVSLWSRTVRVQNLQKKLDEYRSGSAGGSMGQIRRNSSSTPNTAATTTAANAHSSLTEQQRIIIEQLTQKNDELQQQLNDALDQLQTMSPRLAANTAHGVMDLADDEEKQQLRADVRDLEQMLREALDEKGAIQESLDELDGFSRELEEENTTQTDTIKTLQTKCRELQALIDSKGDAEGAARGEADLLRAQLSKTQAKLLEKSRGDEYLQQLTRLHIEHQELQYAHHQLQEKHTRELAEAHTRISELDEKVEELEDEKEELRDTSKMQNSLLWRLLSVASLITRGRAVDLEETNTPVRESQVEAAVKTLTTTVLASMDKPPSVLDSSESRRQMASHGTDAESGLTPAVGVGDEALRQRVRQLEQELVARDAQRDVIVDTKLKRMQDLLLRLHTTNLALQDEMRKCFELNDDLFQFIDKHPKIAPKLSKAGIIPISFKAALDRAKLAKVPQRPQGHN